MHLKMTCQGFPLSRPPAGELEWDSELGRVTGTAAARFIEMAGAALAAGSAPAGPQGAYDFPITNPLHTPAEFAVLVGFAGWLLPPELEAHYPQFPDIFEADPELAAMTPAERARVAF